MGLKKGSLGALASTLGVAAFYASVIFIISKVFLYAL
jgi:hypothetical protein